MQKAGHWDNQSMSDPAPCMGSGVPRLSTEFPRGSGVACHSLCSGSTLYPAGPGCSRILGPVNPPLRVVYSTSSNSRKPNCGDGQTL